MGNDPINDEIRAIRRRLAAIFDKSPIPFSQTQSSPQIGVKLLHRGDREAANDMGYLLPRDRREIGRIDR